MYKHSDCKDILKQNVKCTRSFLPAVKREAAPLQPTILDSCAADGFYNSSSQSVPYDPIIASGKIWRLWLVQYGVTYERLVACSFPSTDNDLIPDWPESCCLSTSANRQTQRLEQSTIAPPLLKKMMTFFGSLNNYFSLSFVITMLIIYGKFFIHKIKSLNIYSLHNCRLLMNDSNENC